MDMAILVENLVAYLYLTLGLSLILQRGFWAKYVEKLINDRESAIPLGVFGLFFGLTLVLTHNYWVWAPPVIVTILGWAVLTKYLVFFLFPGLLFRAVPARKNLGPLLGWGGFILIIIAVVVLLSLETPLGGPVFAGLSAQ